MSVPTPASSATGARSAAAGAAEPAPRRGLRLLGIGVAVFLLLCLVRVVTGAGPLTSFGTLALTLTAATPIAMAGLGGLWSERAGVVNIGLEGMMILGTLGAGYIGYNYGWVAGVLGAIVFGIVGGALHALATVVFAVDHIVSGVAINIIALGISGFLAEVWFSALPGGGPTQSPPLPAVPRIDVPFVSEPAKALAERGWFVVSDLAGLVEVFTRNLSLLHVVGLLLLPLSFWLLWRTRFGLRLRSVGEAPAAAESLGVDVYRYKVVAVLVSGALAGFGGAMIAMVSSSGFQVGMSSGIGYIGLAAMIFGNWRPTGLLVGALLFGYTQALPFRNGPETVHALLLLVGVLLVVVAVVQVVQRKGRTAVWLGVFAVAFLAWFASTDVVPADFTRMSPYVTTLLVLALASQRLRMPAADGVIYRKGAAG
ncbi:ABC transporter permease [Nocardioides aurantiacus]|uniref:Simple sugar transport system permease protein n=1 Tax=Nocardioides aurantiacus TaxID=86796 RepID=A0A3N2CRP2_9ACTN|nr:ABC transporter permease [Nocardioides aurantiacus]ROR90201.1 simple sugar transport system permease protein [Nocardioides aurantiacus]